MPSNPPTVADLVAEVATECGTMLADVGQYLRSLDATTPAILIGLRKGAKAVCLTLSNPMVLQDSDVALLSSFGIERVLDHGKLHALEWVLLNWHRLTSQHQEPASNVAVVSGWLLDEKRAVAGRVAQLKSICDEPYREPTDQAIVVNSRFGGITPTPAQDSAAANCPPSPRHPYFYDYYPHGYGPGGLWYP